MFVAIRITCEIFSPVGWTGRKGEKVTAVCVRDCFTNCSIIFSYDTTEDSQENCFVSRTKILQLGNPSLTRLLLYLF